MSQDRILATCEAHNLEYVTDKTNFQPQLTIRNAIRHVIEGGGSAGLTQQAFPAYPPNIAEQLANINMAAAKLYGNSFNLASDKSHLREVSLHMTTKLLDIDASGMFVSLRRRASLIFIALVDSFIKKYQISSPSGSFMISPSSLKHITSQDIQDAFIYRVVRYVSPYPWGSPKAELGRRKASVQRLVAHLWDSQHLRSQNNSSLCVGSGVLWKLVATTNKRPCNDETQNLAWIAFRQPPPRSGHSLNRSSPLVLDITDEIIQHRNNGNVLPCLDVLFDGRFLIRFQVEKLPKPILESFSDGGRLIVDTRQIWATPQVTHVHGGEVVILHTHTDDSTPSIKIHAGPSIRSDWISSHYIRSLSAI